MPIRGWTCQLQKSADSLSLNAARHGRDACARESMIFYMIFSTLPRSNLIAWAFLKKTRFLVVVVVVVVVVVIVVVAAVAATPITNTSKIATRAQGSPCSERYRYRTLSQ